jgi:ADP-dependent NAD(P)H-hydrate dehydratase / NAD(P)H-hydrate epimerase
MIPVLTSEQMQGVDTYTIERLGLPGAVLMESAGRAVADSIRRFPATAGCNAPVVFCGRGNNGGDGFVVARCLIDNCAAGWPKVILAGRLESLSGDAALMASSAVNFGVEVTELTDSDLSPLADVLDGCDLVVDGLLGSGASGSPRGLVDLIIAEVNERSLPVVAIDSPTGVEMDSGAVPGSCLAADLTVTFGCEKPGHRFFPGLECCGEVVCADIGFPRQAVEQADCGLFICESDDVAGLLPARKAFSNKGDYGKLLVIGGSTGLTGAPAMSSMAAMSAGAGMVTAAVPESLNQIFEIKLTEVMTLPLPDDGRGSFTPLAVEPVARFIADGMDVVALGPGIGRDMQTVEFIRQLAPCVNVPVVLDADGLNAFTAEAQALSAFAGPLVLTPHPGEMARLLGVSTKNVLDSPLEAAQQLSSLSGAVVLLKGPPTVICSNNSPSVISPTGCSALAKAGTGDVLTGAIAALIAQGMEAFEAAYCGAYLHGLAGELAAEAFGQYSVIATQLNRALPEAIRTVLGEG